MNSFYLKENLINRLALVISCSDNNIQTIKNILVQELHEYDISLITNTEITLMDKDSDDELLRYLCIGKLGSNRDKETMNQYIRVAKQLTEFTNKSLKNITSDDIQYFLVMWGNIYKIKSTTMETKRLYLSSIFSYLHKHRKIKENPMDLIEPIRCTKTIKKPLSDEEIERLRLSCKDLRERAIMEFFLSTGVRVSELGNIRICDVDFVNRRVKVLGKGKKERFVYYNETCMVHLQNYLDSRTDIEPWYERGGCYNIAPLFKGKKSNGSHLHKNGIEKIVKQLGQRADIPRLHCHLFRATYATNMAKKGLSLNVIAVLLGHANLNTLSRYVITTDDQVVIALKKLGAA